MSPNNPRGGASAPSEATMRASSPASVEASADRPAVKTGEARHGPTNTPGAPAGQGNGGAAVTVEDLTVAYDVKPALWDIDVTFPDGRLTAIVGPNGAGKSTLVKAVLDLVPSSSGRALIFGRPYRDMRRHVAYVPQRGSVDWDFPTNALDVVIMGRYGHLGWLRRPRAAERDLALQALDTVGMASYAGRQISQLSGGQQQRVFLARALVQDAAVYLMDEPFAGVDATTERAILDLLRELRSAGKAVIVVHHDLATVRDYFDHVVLLNVQVIADGEMGTTFTSENLERTYGGTIALAASPVSPGDGPETPRSSSP